MKNGHTNVYNNTVYDTRAFWDTWVLYRMSRRTRRYLYGRRFQNVKTFSGRIDGGWEGVSKGDKTENDNDP